MAWGRWQPWLAQLKRRRKHTYVIFNMCLFSRDIGRIARVACSFFIVFVAIVIAAILVVAILVVAIVFVALPCVR